jgi:TetR/AcrR family transcriptional repressor of nem operon
MEVSMRDIHHESKSALIDAALTVIRTKGYTATRIEDICEAAHLTKGSFFHHFKSKEDLAITAAERWITLSEELFGSAPYRNLSDPVDRLLAYIDFRKSLLNGSLPEFTCLVGTMVQEVYESYPAIRDVCERSISAHAKLLEADIAQAMRLYCKDPAFSAESVALYTQTVLQGAFVLAKAKLSPAVAIDSLDHLRRYIEMLFAARKSLRKPVRRQ